MPDAEAPLLPLDLPGPAGTVLAPSAVPAPAPAARGSGPAAGERAVYGLLTVSGMDIAILSSAIREVVPAPARLIQFPATRADVRGAIDLRGDVIPVLDLARTLGVTDAVDRVLSAPAPAIVAVLRLGGGVLGVLADRIGGVVTLDGASASGLAVSGGGDAAGLVSGTFACAGMRGAIVDPVAVAALPGLPVAPDSTGVSRRAVDAVTPALVFRVGPLRCAVPASVVEASVPWQALLPAPRGDGLWFAMLAHNGWELPVVDTLALLGHDGEGAARKAGSAVVLRVGAERRVALVIDAVEDIVRLRPSDIFARGAGRLESLAFAAGLVATPAGPALFLDADALTGDPRLRDLGSVRQLPKGAAQAGAILPGSGAVPSVGQRAALAGEDVAIAPYLVTEAGGARLAIPLARIEAIVPNTGPLAPLPDRGEGAVGMVVHRGEALVVLDLARRLGHHAGRGADAGFILVCAEEGRRVGLRVDETRSVERARLQCLSAERGSPRHTAAERTIALADGACVVLDVGAIIAGLEPQA